MPQAEAKKLGLIKTISTKDTPVAGKEEKGDKDKKGAADPKDKKGKDSGDAKKGQPPAGNKEN